jgi:p-cumate 2,3-dioxygenase beta subunit
VSGTTAVSEPLSVRVTTFLAREAWLLDNWQLDEWLTLIDEDIQYVIPATDAPAGDVNSSVVFINDDIAMLRARVTRLKSRHAYREYPTSRTRRFITNVLADEPGDGSVHVTASFQVYRFRNRETAVYVGWYEMTLVPDGASFRITRRKATLDQEALDEHGAISIIL